MGHERIQYLPKSKKWRDIVNEMSLYNSDKKQVSQIASLTISNTRGRFRRIQTDEGVVAAFQFLIELSLSFQKESPKEELESKGIEIQSFDSPIQITKAAHQWILAQKQSAEYCNIAKSAVGDALVSWYQKNTTGQLNIFDSKGESNEIWKKTSDGRGFCELSRMFFAHFTERYLNYFLEREASSAIRTLEERDLFKSQLKSHVNQISKHAFETAKIAQSFSAGWYNKHTKKGSPSKREIKGFLGVAFGKLRDELGREVVL